MQVHLVKALSIHCKPKEDVGEELAKLLKEYAATENKPKEQLKVLAKIRDFLLKNEGLIMEQCYLNGWDPKGPWAQDYTRFFNHAINLIDAELFNPQTPAHNSFNAIYPLLATLDTLLQTKK
jgi:hypothetical protein